MPPLTRAFLFAGAATVAAPACAQTSPAPCHDVGGAPVPCVAAGPSAVSENSTLPQAPAVPHDAESDADVIVVTGTRIPRTEYDAPNPVVSITSATLENSGLTNVTDFLASYPALVGSQTSATTAGGDSINSETGLNLLNLRNLGTNRTLVLVDGRRHVASEGGTAAVDINTIPADLIERVDVLTGGVSAIYGADAVSGVVNFVMKKNFEGLIAHAQTGFSSRGDADQTSASLTVGRNFADSRGNVSFAYQYGKESRLSSYDRQRLNVANRRVFVPNPDDAGDDPNVPDRIPITDARYAESSRNGAIDVDGDGVPDYTGDGLPFDYGTEYANGITQGGSSTPVADYGEDLQPKVERHIFNGFAHFDVKDSLTLYAELKYASIKAFTLGQPTFDYYLQLEPDNPYLRTLPPEAQAAIAANGGALVNRDNFDLGLRGEDITRHTIRSVIGARGDFSSTVHYDLSYTFGRTKIKNRLIADQYSDRFVAALDAVDDGNGGVTCRVNVDPAYVPNQPYLGAGNVFGSPRTVLTPTTFAPGDCVPLNIVGEGVASPEAIAWITTPTTQRQKLTQHVVSGAISGDSGGLFSLPGGPLGFAVGAEYRYEGYDNIPDPLVQQGLTFTNQQDATSNHFSVKEVFGELNAPILKDVPFAKILSLGGAIRYSDYTTVGHTLTWNVNGNYAPISDVEFRATYSHSVRAPNLGELYGASQDYEIIDDPCINYNQNSGSATRAANCAALLGGLGVDPATFQDDRSFTLPGTAAGNPNLDAETAKALTLGVVLRPRFLPGFNLALDWYDIKIANAINTVAAQRIADLCVDAPSLNNNYCSLIQRDPATGLIIDYQVEPQNVAAYRTRGLDVNLNYFIHPDWKYGSFAVQVVGNYLNKLSFISLPGADPTNDLGTNLPAPHYQVTGDLTWKIGKFSLNYGVQWFSKTYRYTRLTSSTQPDIVAPEYFKYRALWQHDVEASLDVMDRIKVYAGVNNLTDRQPDIGTSAYPISAVGRFFFVGAQVHFNKLP